MPELFGIDAAGFQKLVHDLGLEDGRSVSKELQLAMVLQVVRQIQHLRSIGARDQRAKDTISKYFKLVLETLANPDGFYAKQVVMPTAADPPPPQLSQEPRFAGYFHGCIGSIDGTHLPIMSVSGSKMTLECASLIPRGTGERLLGPTNDRGSTGGLSGIDMGS
jgi:hypothetical protein